jgi:hypothetical protein
MKTTKRIEWAYPSSENACKFGFSKTGCWVVEIERPLPSMRPPNAVAGFESHAEAKSHGDSMPEPWDSFTK